MDCFVACAPRNDENLKHRDVFQERDHAEDDHDDARDLLGAAVKRQHVDQIKNENNDEKCDEYADKHPKVPLNHVKSEINRLLTRGGPTRSGQGTAAHKATPPFAPPDKYGYHAI